MLTNLVPSCLCVRPAFTGRNAHQGTKARRMRRTYRGACPKISLLMEMCQLTGDHNEHQLDLSFSDYWCEIELFWKFSGMFWLKLKGEKTFYFQCTTVYRIECAPRWKIGSLSYYEVPLTGDDRRTVFDRRILIEDVTTGNRIYCGRFIIRPRFSVNEFVDTGKWDPDSVYDCPSPALSDTSGVPIMES